MNILYRSIKLIALGVMACIPVFAFAAGQPTFSVLGVSDIKSNEVIVSVAYDSSGASYQYEAQPQITVVYTNQTTGVTLTSMSIGQAIGSRTTLFALRNLSPGTNYSYHAVMNYNGVTSITNYATFKTTATAAPFILDGGQVSPTGSPSVSIVGVQEITSSDALISLAYDSRDAQYSSNTEPKVSIEYTNLTTGETLTSLSIGESVGSRNTLIRLHDLKPKTKYSFKAVIYYAGNHYDTSARTFTTKDTTQLVLTTNSSTSTDIPDLFPAVTVVAKTVGITKGSTNLESIIKTGGYGTKNGVSLAITDSHARVLSGDTFDYSIQYYNANNKPLKIARIVVQLPDQYVFDQGDGNTVYSNNDNVVTIYLGTIAANESGSVTFKAKALGGENKGVETKALLIYTGGSVSATDRDTYVGGSQSVLGATVFGSGFFPQTFFGWLLIIVVLIIIMIVARRYMTPVPPKKEEEEKK